MAQRDRHVDPALALRFCSCTPALCRYRREPSVASQKLIELIDTPKTEAILSDETKRTLVGDKRTCRKP